MSSSPLKKLPITGKEASAETVLLKKHLSKRRKHIVRSALATSAKGKMESASLIVNVHTTPKQIKTATGRLRSMNTSTSVEKANAEVESVDVEVNAVCKA